MLWAELPPEAWTEHAVHRKDGIYTWIDRYTNEFGSSCCQDKDCLLIAQDRVAQERGGWRLLDHGVVWPFAKTHPSEDGKFYLCIWGGKMQCFFAPHSGS